MVADRQRFILYGFAPQSGAFPLDQLRQRVPLRVSDRKTEVVGAETDFSVVPDVKAAAGSLAGRSVGGKGRIAVPGHRDLYL